MKTHNPQNERIKRAYFTYLVEARGYSEATLDGVAKAINRFETYTRFRDFKTFHIEQAKGFKASLAEQISARTKDPLSKATLHVTLGALKQFFMWLAGQLGYKSKISTAGLPYFNPHSFRKTLALLGGQVCKSPEEYKAWSQNLGHESVLTTFSSYGDVARHRQAEIIRAIGKLGDRADV
jgi:integrase